MKKITARQKQVLDFISDFISKNSYAPSIREIQSYFGLKSTKGVKDHIDRLVQKGYLRRSDGTARALIVTGHSTALPVRNVPVVGRVAAGIPLLAEQNIQEYIPVSRKTARSDDMFYLRVRGDSMIGAGILEGDLVLVRPQPFVEQGEIAVVLIDNEATVKRFYMRNNRIELLPENPEYDPIICLGNEEVSIIGKVTAVFRQLE